MGAATNHDSSFPLEITPTFAEWPHMAQFVPQELALTGQEGSGALAKEELLLCVFAWLHTWGVVPQGLCPAEAPGTEHFLATVSCLFR